MVWYAKLSHMFGGNVVLNNSFYIDSNGRLQPQPEPGSPDESRCQMFSDLFTQVDVDDSAEGASVVSEPVAPAPDAAEVAVAETESAPTPSIIGSTGLIESPTVAKRVKSKIGG